MNDYNCSCVAGYTGKNCSISKLLSTYLTNLLLPLAWKYLGEDNYSNNNDDNNNNNNIKQLLDEVFVISRIIKVEIGVIRRSRRLRLITLPRPWLFWISQKPNLIIVLLYIERILSFPLRHKMFSKFVPTLSFPQVLSVFSLSCNQQTAPLPPSSTFLCFVSPCLQLFSWCLARSRSVNEANLKVIFLLRHWRQATQSART